MRRLSYAVCCAALVAACAQESSTPASPGCLMYGGSTCVVGGSTTEAACAAQAGVWQAGGCPGEGQLGTCAVNAGTSVVYYSGWWTATSAEYACAGTWMPIAEPPATTPPPGSGTGSGATASCTVTLSGVVYGCYELIGPPEIVASLQAQCAAPYGAYADAACAIASVPGYCQVTDADYPGVEERVHYSSTLYTPAEAQADCTDPQGTAGVWVN